MFHVRVIPAAAVLMAALSLSACSGTSSNFDPTDWITGEFFDTKTKLPGDRKAVFPEGVPGVPEGVPKELVKGNQQQQPVMEASAAPAAEPAPAAKPAPKRQAAKPVARPRTASAPPRPVAARTASPPQAQPQAQPQPASQPAVAWPDPNTGRTPAQPAASSPPSTQANWPPPDPNTFSR
jgi:hypothetical protein